MFNPDEKFSTTLCWYRLYSPIVSNGSGTQAEALAA